MTALLAAHFIAVSVGLAVAGLIASGHQPVTRRRPRVPVVQTHPTALVALPLLFRIAPLTVIGNARGRQLERRRLDMVVLAIIVAGSWSLLSGTVLLIALTSLGVPAG
jgi:hypothetical protein